MQQRIMGFRRSYLGKALKDGLFKEVIFEVRPKPGGVQLEKNREGMTGRISTKLSLFEEKCSRFIYLFITLYLNSSGK